MYYYICVYNNIYCVYNTYINNCKKRNDLSNRINYMFEVSIKPAIMWPNMQCNAVLPWRNAYETMWLSMDTVQIVRITFTNYVEFVNFHISEVGHTWISACTFDCFFETSLVCLISLPSWPLGGNRVSHQLFYEINMFINLKIIIFNIFNVLNIIIFKFINNI